MTTKTQSYWAVDQSTGEIISGPHAALFRGGIWHIPASAIITKPLPKKEGFSVLALSDGSGTEYIEDHRSKTVYDKQTKQPRNVSDLGPLPDEVTESMPRDDQVWSGNSWEVDPTAIERHKAKAIATINGWRDKQEQENLQFEHAGYNWDGGIDSKTRMDETLALSTALGDLPVGFFWTTANNLDVPMDKSALQSLASALTTARGLRGFEIHTRQRQMKEEVAALTSIDAVKGYVIGWPEAGDA